MTILWINFFIVFVAGVLARVFGRSTPNEIPYVKPNKLFLFIALLSLIVVSGLRSDIGDTFFYMHSYSLLTSSFHDLSFKGDFGFNVFQILLHNISDNPQILVFTTALITNAFIVVILTKYSRMIEISLFVYIAAGMYTVSMNGIRQYLAAGFIFAATKYILNGDWKKYMLVILFAALFHKTALIMIPIYFVVRRPAWTRMTYLLLVGGIIIVAVFNQFYNALFSVLSNTQYGHYQDVSAHGASVMRVIVAAVPIIIAYFGREKLREMWPKSDYIVNIAILDVVFLIIATKNWLFARFDIYFGLYSLILMSWIIELFSRRYKMAVYYALIVCYLIYFYYEQVIKLGMIYVSHYI